MSVLPCMRGYLRLERRAGRAALVLSGEWGLNSDAFEPFERRWDLLMFLLVLYSAVADPYRASFMDLSPKWWDWCVDGFFYIDIVLCFHTGMVNHGASEVNFERSSRDGSPLEDPCEQPRKIDAVDEANVDRRSNDGPRLEDQCEPAQMSDSGANASASSS